MKISYLKNGTLTDINNYAFIVRNDNDSIDTIVTIFKDNKNFSHNKRIEKKYQKTLHAISSKCLCESLL
jgi:hypothetical protein